MDFQILHAKSFKKVRISRGKVKLNKTLSKLFSEREKLKSIVSNSLLLGKVEFGIAESNLNAIEHKIAEETAEENFNTIKDHVKHLVDDTENLNCIKMWQLKKKVCSTDPELPVAKKNEHGELVTEPEKLKKLYETTYKKRLEHRQMKPELMNLHKLKMGLFDIRLEVTANIKSEMW